MVRTAGERQMIRPSTRTLTTAVLGALIAIGSTAPAFAQQHDDTDKTDQKSRRHQRNEERRQAPQQEAAAQPAEAQRMPERPMQSAAPERNENWADQARQPAERRAQMGGALQAH